MTEKICTKCGTAKALDAFTKNKNSSDGLAYVCKTCHKEYGIKYRKENKKTIAERDEKYRREHAEQRKQYRAEYYTKNKELVAEQMKKYRTGKEEYFAKYKKQHRIDNPKMYAVYGQKWRRNNPEKDRLIVHRRNSQKRRLDASFTVLEWAKAKYNFQDCCAYCGQETTKLEQEHVIPPARGGAYNSQNIIPACRRCNSSKNNRDLWVWYLQQPFYSPERANEIARYLQSQIIQPHIGGWGEAGRIAIENYLTEVSA